MQLLPLLPCCVNYLPNSIAFQNYLTLLTGSTKAFLSPIVNPRDIDGGSLEIATARLASRYLCMYGTPIHVPLTDKVRLVDVLVDTLTQTPTTLDNNTAVALVGLGGKGQGSRLI